MAALQKILIFVTYQKRASISISHNYYFSLILMASLLSSYNHAPFFFVPWYYALQIDDLSTFSSWTLSEVSTRIAMCSSSSSPQFMNLFLLTVWSSPIIPLPSPLSSRLSCQKVAKGESKLRNLKAPRRLQVLLLFLLKGQGKTKVFVSIHRSSPAF